MHLVRDVLDSKVVDRNGREMGRVDGLVLEVIQGQPPRVAAIQLGPTILADRIHPVLGRCAAALEVIFGIHEGRPVRIPFEDVIDLSDHVKVDRAFGETAVAAVEQRLRRLIGSLLR